MRNPLPPGCRIDEYKVVRVLGTGGFGITYLAFDQMLDGWVALKEYFPVAVAVRTDDVRVAASTAGQDVFNWGLDRFLKEARAIHQLRHPSIVRVHRYVERHGTAYIVMEYVEGELLASTLESRGRLSVNEWRPWFDRLLDGLAHVHDHDYLHRDIKPANIVIRASDGEPVLIDFGAARVASQQRTHTQVLTPGYAPYEQHTSKGSQGPPTDIYALAAVSYRVLTGEPPPNAPDRMPDDCYEPLAERVGGVSTGWLAAIDHGLALQPDDRPQTVTAWRVTLHESNRMDAAEMEKLLEAASKEDADALARLRAEADAGNSEAQFALGEAYFALGETYEYDYVNANGELVPADYAAAVAWYHKAADQGHAVAQFRLGRLYQEGVRKDHVAAVAWYRKAAEHGLAGAQYQLGRMYEYGEGVPPDDEAVHAELAVAWYRKAAEHGLAGAQYQLGRMYERGEGVPPDDESVHVKLAVTWYGRAADQEYAEAQYNLGRIYQSGCGDSVLQDAEEAVVWFRKAASRGHVEAQFELGRMYSQGTGVPQDDEEAVAWYRKAASQGHPGAQYYLGEVYHRGSGVPKDAGEAIACYRKAAHGDDEVYSTKAQLALGGMYRTGNGVPTDTAAAKAWYRKAAYAGDLTARFALWEIYARGEGVMSDAEVSVRQFCLHLYNTIDQTVPARTGSGIEGRIAFVRKKADNGDVRAQFELGWYYHNGRGVPEDMETAASWYRKAADQGDARAQFNLGVMHALGEGVPRDLAAAYIWFDLALGDTGKKSHSDDGLHKGALATKRAIEGDMSPSELEEVGIAREE